MKKLNLLIILFFITIVLAGCKGNPVTIDGVKNNTIFIKEDSMINYVYFENFEKDYYDQNELRNFIDEQIKAYNKTAGESAVSVENFEVDQDLAKLTLLYQNMKNYKEFNEENFFLGTIEEAIREEYTLNDAFIEVSSGKEIPKSEVLKDLKLNIVIVSGDVDVITSKKVKYYSVNATLLDKNTVQSPKEGCMIIYKP